MKITLRLPAVTISLITTILTFAQSPEPFDSCPGVSVAITRPGFNATGGPHQIYRVVDSTGEMTAVGDPIDLQINAFGLNINDGFLYGMHQTFNVANPFFMRVGQEGDHEILGRINPPHVSSHKVAVINTAAATMDDNDNYYFMVAVFNLQNVLLPPELYLGKIPRVSRLNESNGSVQHINYKRIDFGTCLDELAVVLQNPLNGAFQDIAWNPSNGLIYSYLPGDGPAPNSGKLVSMNPNDPELNCVDSVGPNIETFDLSGLFFGRDTSLYMLTIDGNYYRVSPDSGTVTLVTLTTLPLLSNNLRGDMASCIGRKRPVPFDDCPGLSLAITRVGVNSTNAPYQIYRVNPETGAMDSIGNPINLQINAFGLNNEDGFLYGMHETTNVIDPFFTRVDTNGNHFDIGRIHPPLTSGDRVGIINTAAATMDGKDNYYFTAITVDTTDPDALPRLYLGRIKRISKLEEGDSVEVRYTRIFLGDCIDEIQSVLDDPGNGLLQDMAYNPKDGKIYTYFPSTSDSPTPGKLASFRVNGNYSVLNCIDPSQPNVETMDLSGMFATRDGKLYILTIDGKYYKANTNNGVVSLVTQTTLPLESNNLRGDMASCVGHHRHHNGGGDDDDHDGDDDDDEDDDDGRIDINRETIEMRIAPNPVNTSQFMLNVESPTTGRYQMQIVDVNNNIIVSRPITINRGSNQFTIAAGNLGRGYYSLVLTSEFGSRSSVKFIRL